MQIGIIGSGEMGTVLAAKLVKLGHGVSMANSRGPSSLAELTEAIGAKASAVEDITRGKKLIIVSIPQKNIPDLPKNLFYQVPDDVVIIDTGNYYPNLRDGHIPALEENGIDSVWVEEQLGIPVIKVFNSILATSIKDLGRPGGRKDRIAIAVSGDSAGSKELVFKLNDELGFDSFDTGNLSNSWKQQPGSSVYCRDINIKELEKRISAMKGDWSEMRGVILAKREADEALMKTDYPAYLKTLEE